MGTMLSVAIRGGDEAARKSWHAPPSGPLVVGAAGQARPVIGHFVHRFLLEMLELPGV